VEVLRWGYRIQFRDRPPTSLHPICPSDSHHLKNIIIQEQIDSLLSKGALEEVPQPVGPGFYSRLFVVPKPNGTWRPIIDLKRLNDFVLIPRFKMESLHTVWAALIPGNLTFSIDLSDAYFHVPMHPSSRKYLRIFFQGKVYQFKALPFGLSTSPWIFTKVMAEVKVMSHLQGILLYLYLDDWLVQIMNYLQGLAQASFMVDLCAQLGLLVNLDKSDLVPSYQFDFLGATFNLDLCRVFPKQDNILKLQAKLQLFLQSLSRTAREWQSLLGSMASQSHFILYARLHMRPLQWHLASRWTQGVDSPDQQIPISLLIKACLRWWWSRTLLLEGVPLIHPPASVRIFSDASTQGWGAHVGDVLLQGQWDPDEQGLHINILEMRAVRLALVQCPPPQAASILISTDSTTVVAYINNQGGTHSWSLMEETASLFLLVMRNKWFVRAKYIPGKLNVIADQLSRRGQTLPSEWSLHQEAADLLFQRWGKPLIDLCATRHNTKCPLFVAPAPDSRALWVDALTMEFEGLQAYVYPPQQIISKILQKFSQTRVCSLILVAPFWPNQHWFPLLNLLAVEPPVQLPQWRNLLKQSLSDIFHQSPEVLNLHAWFLVKKP